MGDCCQASLHTNGSYRESVMCCSLHLHPIDLVDLAGLGALLARMKRLDCCNVLVDMFPEVRRSSLFVCRDSSRSIL